MADIIVDVSLPNPITTNVTSPTQALGSNVYIPGPQGPAGPKGNPTTINSLGAENIIITGADGNIVYTTGLNTIFISGNSGYFQSAVNSLTTNLDNTGSSLINSINSLSGLFTGHTGSLDNNYATDAQLQSTGSNLYTLLINFSGNLDATYASDLQLFNTGSTLDNKINSLSGYSASDVNLVSTGSNLDIKINNLSGNLTSNYATITNLASTGSVLDSKINSLSGSSASAINLANTGSSLDNKINSLSGNLTANYSTITNLATTGSTLDSKINSLSGYSASIINLQSTGSNLYSMLTGFSGNLDAIYATDSQLYTTGSTLDNKINSLSGWSASEVNLTSTGVTLINNLFNTGSNLNTKINDLSGYVNTQDNNISTNLYNTGNTLNNKINSLSGYTDSQDTNISSNLRTTGSTLDTKINNLSGYVNTQDTTISNNLTTTGITLDNKINSLSGSSVLLYGNQSIGGVKTFRDNVYINNLFVTGTETIVSTNNFNVQSPYLILNITGGAVDGGIFFITGAGLTGINDTGPIIGFDHSTKFKFGISTRNSDLSTLPDIASVQQIEAYSGVANNRFSTISNLTSTGVSLGTRIDTLTTNLSTTGSTLGTRIDTLSTNLVSTGSALNTRINNLSGYINSSASNIVFTTGNQTISGTKTFIQDTTFGDSAQGDFLVISGNNFTVYGSGNFTSGLFVNGNQVLTGSSTLYATSANLASTGSTLDNKINSLSGVSVLTFGNQTISGVKTFTSSGIFSSGLNLNNSNLINATPDLLNVSASFDITGTQNSRLILANSPTIITGSIVSGNPIGFNTSIIQIGLGQVLITGIGSNVIVNSYNNQFRTAAQYATISILHTGNNGYIMYGNTST